MTRLPTPKELHFINNYIDLAVKSKTLPKNLTHFKENGVWRQYDLDVQVARCFIVIMKGWDIGLSASYSVDEISIIEGKPSASAKVMLAKVEEFYPNAHYIVKEWTKKKCVITARKDYTQDIEIFPMTTFSFSIEEARDAGLLSKWNWKSYPKIMLKWRAVTDMCRTVYPRAILGFYIPDELGQDHSITEEESNEELIFPDMEKYKEIGESQKKELIPEKTKKTIDVEPVKEKKKKIKKTTTKKSAVNLLNTTRPSFKIPKRITKTLNEVDNIKEAEKEIKEMEQDLKDDIAKIPEPSKPTIKPRGFVIPSRRPKINFSKKLKIGQVPKLNLEKEKQIEEVTKLIEKKGKAKFVIRDKVWNAIISKDNWLSSQTAKSKMDEDFALDMMEVHIQTIS